MDQSLNPLVREEGLTLSPLELLQKPVTILQGTPEAAVDALKKIDIMTVFDLAASSVFNVANRITDAMSTESELGAIGRVPTDMVDVDALNVPLKELHTKDISVLRAIDPQTASAIKSTLPVSTIRDLALWPPYHAARLILNAAYGLQDGVGENPEMPQELVPGVGQFPTERVQYQVVLLERIFHTDNNPTASEVLEPGSVRTGRRAQFPFPLPNPIGGPVNSTNGGGPIQNAGPIDITLATKELGFTKIAIGAILTMTQSWFTHGLALGQLLHTVALAPGESTRIAMIDWSRISRAAATENITEKEFLVSDLSRNRSINEVINVVAKESQSGFSGSFGAGAGTGAGEGGGAAGGIEYGIFKGAGAAGNSTGWALSGGYAQSWASSAGERNIGANMTQQVLDSTHQASSVVRNRRATIVREVSQQESERVSTRSLTNYNHMHALSLQYYEIVQLYKVVVELSQVNPCLFVPMRLIDFTNAAIIDRFRTVIAAAGLTPQVQALIEAEPEMLFISVPKKNTDTWSQSNLNALAYFFGQKVGYPDSKFLVFPMNFRPKYLYISGIRPSGLKFESITLEQLSGPTLDLELKPGRYNKDPWYGNLGVSLDEKFKPDPQTKRSQFWNVTALKINRDTTSSTDAGLATVNLAMSRVDDETPDYTFTVQLKIDEDEMDIPVLEIGRTLRNNALQRHLEENALYYSQAIWRSLDAAMLGSLLSGYTLGSRPLLEVIDPKPVTLAANYLGFRLHGLETDEWWETFLQDKQLIIGTKREDLVPMPTGGVFAEAVLGRFNSAEKLDITRFWNWQDSPIPFSAPEIAAITTGSRAQPEPITPGQLSSPVVNIVNPPAIPDPQGLSAALTALANGNMFRDMSGLASTIGFAQAAMQGAMQGAEEFGRQAGQNAKTAADLLAKLYGSGAGSREQGGNGLKPVPTSPSTISNAGGRINYGEKLDQQAKDSSTVGSSSAGDGAGGGTSDATSDTSRDFSAARDAFYTDLGGFDGLAGGEGAGLLSNILRMIMGATKSSSLALGQKVPNKNEVDVVGAITAKVVRGTPEFNALVENTNPDIVFKDEEGTGADRMMTPRLKSKLNDLAELVKKEWPGKNLRVTEAWDESNEHAATSTHYEGRAADITVSDQDNGKLGRLAQLAVDAGLEWVYYENAVHVHVSMAK